jgi:dihydrofolate reductase
VLGGGRGVAQPRQELDAEIGVSRSAQPVQTPIENNLVYELRLMIYPVVLEPGRRVFGEPTDKRALRVVDSKTVGDGIVILIHAPTRARATGV